MPRERYPILPIFTPPQALYNPELFRADVVAVNNGVPNIRWERRFSCPCSWRTTLGGVTGEVGGEQRIECPRCRNSGRYFVRMPDTYARVADAGAVTAKNGKLEGDSWQSIQAKFTCLPETSPRDGDRLTVLTAWIQVEERRVRRATRESLRFPLEAKEVVHASPNSCSTPVCDYETVIELAWADESGAFVAVCTEGEAFTVIDGQIDFSTGDLAELAPRVGCDYVVTYWAHPRYVIQGHPFIHRSSPTRLPHQVGEPEPVRATEMNSLAIGLLELVGPAAGSTGV